MGMDVLRRIFLYICLSISLVKGFLVYMPSISLVKGKEIRYGFPPSCIHPLQLSTCRTTSGDMK